MLAPCLDKDQRSESQLVQIYLTETQCRRHAGSDIEASSLYDAATQCPDGFIVVGVKVRGVDTTSGYPEGHG